MLTHTVPAFSAFAVRIAFLTSRVHTAAASPFPTNAQVADLAHEQTALVGYVHPLESVPHPEKDSLTYELPADVALVVTNLIEMDPRALPSRVELRPSEPKK